MSLLRENAAPKRSLAGFLLSPLVTGLLLPGFLLVAGAIYHFTIVGRQQKIENSLREEISTLRQERKQLEGKVRLLQEGR